MPARAAQRCIAPPMHLGQLGNTVIQHGMAVTEFLHWPWPVIYLDRLVQHLQRFAPAMTLRLADASDVFQNGLAVPCSNALSVTDVQPSPHTHLGPAERFCKTA